MALSAKPLAVGCIPFAGNDGEEGVEYLRC